MDMLNQRNISGWLMLDKPYGVTSASAVNRVRYIYGAAKAGHAGTLDPLATGLLPIALGEATKTVSYVQDGQKVYEFRVVWGTRTLTEDLEGEIIAQSNKRPTRFEVERILPKFIGEIKQVPPNFSALKVNGERAYDLAREGFDFSLTARPISIFGLKLMHHDPDCQFSDFILTCSKGTYVRSLARDMGLALGCYGYVDQLRRSSVYPFNKYPMHKLSDLEMLCPRKPFLRLKDISKKEFSGLDKCLLDTQAALSGFHEFIITDPETITKLRNGNSVMLHRSSMNISDPIYLTSNGVLLAIGNLEDQTFKPSRVFNL